VELVEVDVSVLDKDRRPVRGLTQSNFTVLEDGKPRPVVTFVPVQLADAGPRPAAAPWVRDVSADVTTNEVRPEGRLVIIMFDWSIRFEDQILARRIAAAAVDRLGPDDLAAVVFSSAFGNAGTPQNFTADRARLLSAINRPFGLAMHNPPVGPAHDPRNTNEKMIDDPEGYEAGDCLCRVCVPETIARIADTIRDVRGRRKVLFFIGTYFRTNENMLGPATRQGGVGGFLKGSQMSFVRPGVCSAPLNDAREKMIRATSLANLTIHTLDPVGVETAENSPLGGSILGIRERQDELRVLADTTGGRTVMDTDAPEAQLPALLAESSAYYLLAFAPADPTANGKFHRIEVKVDRRDLAVRTREGYYAGEKRTSARKPTVISPETTAALEGVLPRTDLPLAVTVAPFALPGRSESTVSIVVNARQQVARDRAVRNGPVKVLVAAFDRSGRSVQSEDKTVSVTWRPDAAGSAPYELLSRLTLKPGRYEVRAAVDGGVSQRASVHTYVDVPDFAAQPLSLSGIVVGAVPQLPAVPADAFARFLPVVPTARRDFAPADRATAFLQIYRQARKPAGPVTVSTRIVDTHDRSQLEETTELAPERFVSAAADFRIDLPLDRLTPGQYLLTIQATDGQLAAGRALRFNVR
jgi:VWFA-related protein